MNGELCLHSQRFSHTVHTIKLIFLHNMNIREYLIFLHFALLSLVYKENEKKEKKKNAQFSFEHKKHNNTKSLQPFGWNG